jgi:hypothetical protein
MLFPRNILLENDGTLFMTLFIDWKMNLFKLVLPPSTGTCKSSFVLRQTTISDDCVISNSLGFTLIPDDLNEPNSGYYISGYAHIKDCGSGIFEAKGGYIIRLSNTGVITWESYPSTYSNLRLQYLDLL